MAIVIEKLKARQILDSRGNPTVEVEILLNNGIGAISSVPSGASKVKTLPPLWEWLRAIKGILSN